MLDAPGCGHQHRRQTPQHTGWFSGRLGGFGEAEAKPLGFGAPSSITQGWDQRSSGTALAGEGVSCRGGA